MSDDLEKGLDRSKRLLSEMRNESDMSLIKLLVSGSCTNSNKIEVYIDANQWNIEYSSDFNKPRKLMESEYFSSYCTGESYGSNSDQVICYDIFCNEFWVTVGECKSSSAEACNVLLQNESSVRILKVIWMKKRIT